MNKWVKRILLAVGVLAVLGGAGFTYLVGGPRNLIGMLRYDQRREGDLKVGDRAPDVTMIAPDGKTPVSLFAGSAGRPTVLIFGSFT